MTFIDCPFLAISYPKILFNTTTSYFLGSSYIYTSSAADALFKNTWTINIPFLLSPSPSDAPSFIVSSSICPCLMTPVKRWERKWKFGTKPRFSRGTNMLCVNIKALSTELSLSQAVGPMVQCLITGPHDKAP